jgi:hypothetical protein
VDPGAGALLVCSAARGEAVLCGVVVPLALAENGLLEPARAVAVDRRALLDVVVDLRLLLIDPCGLALKGLERKTGGALRRGLLLALGVELCEHQVTPGNAREGGVLPEVQSAARVDKSVHAAVARADAAVVRALCGGVLLYHKALHVRAAPEAIIVHRERGVAVRARPLCVVEHPERRRLPNRIQEERHLASALVESVESVGLRSLSEQCVIALKGMIP